jgi:hypothetical protein
MADIFISYAKEDRPRVAALVKALAEYGWSIWWDQTIPAGKAWREVIGEALENAGALIVIWSKTSVKSKWVQEEADWGLERKILVPVLIDQIRPPLGFGAVQALDFVNWNPAKSSPEFQKLVFDLSTILGPCPKHIRDTEQTAENKFEQPTPHQAVAARVKLPEPRAVAPATTQPKPPEAHRVNNILRFTAVLGIILLMAGGIWWFISKSEEAKRIAKAKPPIFETKTGKLFVVGVPDNASIRILNVDKRFQQGIELEPGKYHVQVSSRDYETQDRWIELNANEEKRINFELKKEVPKAARLHVQAIPENAQVRILNIGPKFTPGMALEAGSYQLEVSAEGYETQIRWIELKPGDEEPFKF